eukprot:7986419-Pyramimonas_sp.AAC.1
MGQPWYYVTLSVTWHRPTTAGAHTNRARQPRGGGAADSGAAGGGARGGPPAGRHPRQSGRAALPHRLRHQPHRRQPLAACFARQTQPSLERASTVSAKRRPDAAGAGTRVGGDKGSRSSYGHPT